jgi:hypothetical protein
LRAAARHLQLDALIVGGPPPAGVSEFTDAAEHWVASNLSHDSKIMTSVEE